MADDTVQIAVPDQADIDTPCQAWVQMQDLGAWDLIDDLLGGTKAMRKAGKKWLPQEPREQEQSYNNRLSRSILYNAFKNTIEKLVSKPFSKVISIDGTLPDVLEEVWDDPERSGRDMNEFAKELLSEAVKKGLTHVFVDYPVVPEGATLADEKQTGARPNCVHIPPCDLFYWASEKGVDGVERLTEIRFHEERLVKEGEYGEKEVCFIRQVFRDHWVLWRKAEQSVANGKRWVIESEGLHTFGEIPLATLYTSRTGFMTAEPPLLDLAWLNLAHWQSFSDQRNILRVVRCGILFAAGFTEDEVNKGITIGPNSLIATTNPQAQLKFVEHTGKAIEAGANDLKTTEERMEVMGLQPLIERTGNSTATGAGINEERASTLIQQWIQACEQTILAFLKLAAKWVKLEVPDDCKPNIYSDFGLAIRATDDQTLLLQARKQGDIDRPTLLKEFKRRGTLGEDTDIEAVGEAVDAEAMKLAQQALQMAQGSGGGDPIKPPKDFNKPKPDPAADG